MNENIDLTKILKDVPKGTELWSPAYGKVRFIRISENDEYPVNVETQRLNVVEFTSDGKYFSRYDDTECGLFPSKNQRNWRMFEYKPAPKKVKVVLHPFDRVLTRGRYSDSCWDIEFLSHYREEVKEYVCISISTPNCIPYNKDTAHLLGTTDDCPIDYEIEFSKEYKEE